eukprot:EG_transcript_29981
MLYLSSCTADLETFPHGPLSVCVEAKNVLTLTLQSQLNLYTLSMSPFHDAIVCTADPTLYWQSKLHVAQELAEFAIFLYTIAVTEAAVERTFSAQKFLETPLRNALHEKVVQAALFVKFNLLNFGDDNLIPASLREPKKFFYHKDISLENEAQGDPDLFDDVVSKFWS